MREQLIKSFKYATKHHTFTKTDIVKHSKNVCVYGLGKYFEDAFDRQNIKLRFGVNYLCDSSAERLKSLMQEGRYDVTYILPKQLKEVEDVAVILMLGDPRTAVQQLSRYVSLEKIITFNDLILDDLMTVEHDENYYIAQQKNMLKAFDLLEDDKSKFTFANIISLRIAPHLAKASYDDLFEEPQYFPVDIIKLSQSESVVDCGAYIGDTLESFDAIVEGKCANYYAFELDPENFRELSSKVETKQLDYVTCYPYGVWCETKDISYGRMSSADSYSIFNQCETNRAKVVALDECIKDMPVSLIKMDIEGAEMEALKGCSDIIKKQSPKMAICVYHRIEDMWLIPIYLKEMNDKYRLYIRHHAKWWVSETVCYAV